MESVAEPEYCEMGEFCIHMLGGKSPGAVKLRPTSRTKPLCDRCAEANYRPDDIEMLKHHKKLLAAASVLMDQDAPGEYETIPTLVFATLSDRDEVYARIGERLAAARHDDEDWVDLFKKFSLRFGNIKPKGSVDNVPVVWRPPLGVFLVSGNGGPPFDAVKIEVHKPAKSREVRAYYSEILELYDLPSESGRGLIAWAVSDESMQMVVRPEEDTILHPILKFTISDRLQAPFAHPADVAAMYDALKGRGYLQGRGGGGPPKYYNAIPAVVAWYLSKRVLLEGREDEARKITRLLKACLGGPRKERMPELKGRWQPWRDLKLILSHIEHTEDELCAHTDLGNPYGLVHKTF